MCILIVCIYIEQVNLYWTSVYLYKTSKNFSWNYPISREWWQRFMWKLNVPGFCPKENVLTKYFCPASLSLACCQLLYQEFCWENKLYKGINSTDPIYFVDGALLWEYALYKVSCNSGSWLFSFCNLLSLLHWNSQQFLMSVYLSLTIFWSANTDSCNQTLSVPGDWNLWVSDSALWLPEEQNDGHCS